MNVLEGTTSIVLEGTKTEGYLSIDHLPIHQKVHNLLTEEKEKDPGPAPGRVKVPRVPLAKENQKEKGQDQFDLLDLKP